MKRSCHSGVSRRHQGVSRFQKANSFSLDFDGPKTSHIFVVFLMAARKDEATVSCGLSAKMLLAIQCIWLRRCAFSSEVAKSGLHPDQKGFVVSASITLSLHSICSSFRREYPAKSQSSAPAPCPPTPATAGRSPATPSRESWRRPRKDVHAMPGSH